MEERGSGALNGVVEDGGANGQRSQQNAETPGPSLPALTRRSLLRLSAAAAQLALLNPGGLMELSTTGGRPGERQASGRLASGQGLQRPPGIRPAPGSVGRPGPASLPVALAAADLPVSYTLTLVRPDDMLNLRFEFVNLVPAGAPFDHFEPTGDPAYVIVTFDAQHIAEQSFQEATPPSPPLPAPAPPPVQKALASPSRLAFQVPRTITIPYTPTGLLNWLSWTPSVVPAAKPPHWPPPPPGAVLLGPFIEAPANFQTAIEIPWGLTLSSLYDQANPSTRAAWAHSAVPVIRNGRTELWHTRMGTFKPAVAPAPEGVDENDPTMREVRAIWGRNFNRMVPPTDLTNPPGFTFLPDAKHRYDIVRNSADFTSFNADGSQFTPEAIPVDRLMLSALGGWLNARGEWANRAPAIPTVDGTVPLSQADVSLWHHRAMMGRDQYVRVVIEGCLFPFGHRAACIEVVERKIQPITAPVGTTLPDAGKPVAYLRKRTWVVCRQAVKTYPAFSQKQGREMPFRSIRLAPLSTPDLADRATAPSAISGALGAFWPTLGSGAAATDFLWKAHATDAAGRVVEFSVPLAFVPSSVNSTPSAVAAVIADYTNPLKASRRQRDLQGQMVAFADPVDVQGRERVSLPATSITFGANPVASPGVDQPGFYPTFAQAGVRLLPLEQLSGQAVAATIQFESTYLDSSYGNGGVWATVAGTAPVVNFNTMSDRVGALAAPNLSIKGLSRTLGPVAGDVTSLVGGTFDPSLFFGGLSKLLGGINLADIVAKITATDLATVGDKVPKMFSRTVYEVAGDPTSTPIEVHTRYVWKPTVQSGGVFVSNGATLDLEANMVAYLKTGAEPSFQIAGTLTNFALNLFVLQINFSSLSFKSVKGQKPDIGVQVTGVSFTDPLTFANALRPFMKWGNAVGALGQVSSQALTAASGPSVEVTSSDIRAGYSLVIPSLAFGAFSLQNLALATGVTIPFTGSPVRARFAFSSRESPFLLTVSLFAGGGFFAVDAGPDGIERLEASFEFGGNFALKLGVASGGVYCMAGIYLAMQSSEDKCQLTGYVRLGGALQVLGLVTVSVEFYMSLNYETSSGEVWGQAKVTVEVEVAFFSKSVKLKTERRFAGSKNQGAAALSVGGGQPMLAAAATGSLNFNSLIPDAQTWASYCSAFAGPQGVEPTPTATPVAGGTATPTTTPVPGATATPTATPTPTGAEPTATPVPAGQMAPRVQLPLVKKQAGGGW